MSAFPFEGVLEEAPEKKFEEIVFFVHFFEGSRLQMRRHIDLVKSFGFDTFAFNLESNFSLERPPVSSRGQIGYKHVYADQIEELLNQLPGKKIMYAFSNPAASAIEAMARRHCSDVTALICDSGPSAKFVKSVYNLYAHEKNYFSWLPFGKSAANLAATPVLAVGWSPLLHRDLVPQLDSFPEHFPVLSIRGWKDPLIPPDHIDAAFEGHPQLDWQKLSLPAAGHLNGLRDFPDDYIPPVKRFLEANGTPVKR